jgi:hypothetical protein
LEAARPNTPVSHASLEVEVGQAVASHLCHGETQPLDARFKVAVRNAVINAAQKQMNQRRFLVVSIQQDVEPHQIAARSGVSDSETIEAFRELVRERLGYFGLAVFDLQLTGEDIKSFIGSDEFGRPSTFS